ncbi:MAG: MBL fold metallo-hydrolase [Clostridia bacterium]|nr:MBL fold metallo-hydrolase [Clostridia bacterium]
MRKFASLLLVIIMAFSLYVPAFAESEAAPELKLHFLNQRPVCPEPYVHGDCTLAELPNGQLMLIDSGLDIDPSHTIAWLESHIGDTKHIDYFIGTHYHQDHTGTVDDLMKAGYTFGEYYTNGWGDNNIGVDLDFIAMVWGKTIEEKVLRSGDSLTIGDVVIDVLWPLPDDVPSSMENMDSKELNEHSLVFQMIYGDFTALFAADVLERSEAEIVALHGDRMMSSFYKAAHHGNDDGNSQIFLDTIEPYASLSFARWIYGKNATERIKRISMVHYIVGEDGHVDLVTDGKTMTITCETREPEIFELP